MVKSGVQPRVRRSVARDRERCPIARGHGAPGRVGSGDEVRWDRYLVDLDDRARVLGRAATGPLVDDDPTVLDQLAAPDTPRLDTSERPLEALVTQPALATDRLGASEVERTVRE